MNKLAVDLNESINNANPFVMEMLSELGKKLYFPRGILTQTAEAKDKACNFNATIGIATVGKHVMHTKSLASNICGLNPDEYLSYAPSHGRPDLRKEWKKQLLVNNPSLTADSLSLPIATSGVTHGLSIAADLFINPGDTVIVPEKFWGNYSMIFETRKEAKLITHRLFSDRNGFDTVAFADTLKKHAGSGKVTVIINSPHNPTGWAITKTEAEEIKNALISTAESGCNVIAIFDDSYYGLFFEDDVCRESTFAKVAGMHNRLLAIKVDGATKEHFVWGLRVGFITFSEGSKCPKLYTALEQKAAGNLRGTISNSSNLSQALVLKALQSEEHEKERLACFETLKRRALKVKEILSDNRFSEVWTPYPFNAGYFMCLKLKHIDADTFRLRLLEDYGIGVISEGKTDIRVAFSCVEETCLQEMFETMLKCAISMQN
ncbi:MAG: aminotransferase class I/II-fold pyridoxal phosphate-dependent enzyme [Lentisphaerae bacterium]|nr:aminotransferase class I/II-fold pyridoxal phosphate-dependent enzyme [Lentisphaerota bacterium]